MDFSGMCAVVTGGTGGLGSAVVDAFRKAGTRIAVPVRESPSAAAAREDVLAVQCDLTRERDVSSFFQTVRSALGPVDILVNAAGGYAGGALVEESSLEEVETMIRINYLTAYLACRAALPSMKERRFGRILNIAAKPALAPAARRAAYAASKSALVTLTEVIAEEVKGSGVTCNAIAPSIIKTRANEQSMPDADTSMWVDPGEIAALILFLASRDAGSINGNVIKVFGGV